jgi:hypothetical protein
MPLNVLLCSLAQQTLYTLTWKYQSLFRTTAGVLSSFLPFFRSCSTCLHFWTWLYSITMFLQRPVQSNQQLALSRLMHSIHWGNAMFPCQTIERRPARETLKGVGDWVTKFEDTEHSHWKDLLPSFDGCLPMFYRLQNLFFVDISRSQRQKTIIYTNR